MKAIFFSTDSERKRRTIVWRWKLRRTSRTQQKLQSSNTTLRRRVSLDYANLRRTKDSLKILQNLLYNLFVFFVYFLHCTVLGRHPSRNMYSGAKLRYINQFRLDSRVEVPSKVTTQRRKLQNPAAPPVEYQANGLFIILIRCLRFVKKRKINLTRSDLCRVYVRTVDGTTAHFVTEVTTQK